MTELSERLAALSPEKRLLLELARKQARPAVVELTTPASRPFDLISEEDRRKLPDGIEDAYPLTMLQAGMLYHMELTPDEPAYLNVDSWHLRAPFDEAAFRYAVQVVVARHPVMRTSFDLTSYSEPLQLVHTGVELPVRVEDVRALSFIEQEALLDEVVWSEKTKRFDLARAPQLRFSVHRRSDDSFQLTLTENHAVWDGWSLHSTLTEIFTLYFDLLAGRSIAAEPPLTLSFRDFVRLERDALSSEESRLFWLRLMDGFELTELPRWPDVPGTTTPGPRIRILALPFPKELAQSLRNLGRQAGAPLKSVLLAAHLKVLSLLSGRRDVTSGVAWNGRPEEVDGDRLRGLFLNTLPFRLDLRSDTWTDLVRRTFVLERESLPFRRYPMAALQRQLGGGPLFDISFNYIQFHVVDNLLGSGVIQVLGSKKQEGTDYGLVAHFDQAGLQLEHDVIRLSEGAVRRIGDLYLLVMRRMVTAPTSRHDEELLLPSEERHQLLIEWGRERTSWPEERSLSDLFRKQVENRGDAEALSFGEERLSYRELGRRVLALASRLRRSGVGPEVRVGLCSERSADLVVGILGILEAGGAYVPLDPSYPAERLRFLLESSEIGVVVGQEALRDHLLLGERTWVSLGSGVEEEREEEREEDSGPRPLPDSAAYVIYTSGSTGRPKGVVITHRNVVRLLRATEDFFRFGPTDIWMLFHSYAFDFSVWELWGALAYGGRLVVVPYWVGRTPEAFLDLLEREGVTVLNQTPSAFRQLTQVEGGWDSRLRVRLVVFGGEALEPSSLRSFRQRLSGVRLVNMYGITETTVHVTYCELSATDFAVPASLIGRPIGDLGLYVLDPCGEPVPVGVTGELYVSGAGLGRGYLGRPELTADRFMPSPFGSEPGARLYRTGDLGRYLNHGELEYLGRIDQQVKIRGFRIELGEIEAVLAGHPGVKEAAVMARQTGEGQQRLVAYVVGRPGEVLDLGALHGHLRERLPEHMVPVLVELSAMPLTVNGKVDRRALPAFGADGPEPVAVYAAPRTPTEELLAAIWSDVLKVRRVGIYDEFFTLGGHSLLATRVISRIRAAFRVELPLSDLFEERTIERLAVKIDAARSCGSSTEAPPLEPLARDEEALPLSFAQQQIWLTNQLEPGNSAYNIAAGLCLTGTLDLEALRASFHELVRRHESLRTTFPGSSGQPRQRIHPADKPKLPVVDLEALPETCRDTELERLSAEHAGRPFDLGWGPLFRLILLRMAETEHALLCAMHHIVSDGWSMGVLIRDMAALYEAFAARRPSPLPELTIQYADFTAWQRHWLQGEVLQRQLDYWRQKLAGAPLILPLPTDRPRPPVQRFRGSRQILTLSPALSTSLGSLARRQSATLFMVMLGAFQTLLCRYTAETDLSIGTPIAGRDHIETEGLIGLFVNTLVLRGDLTGDPRFDELLEQSREMVLEAQERRHLPFERLVEELQPERNLAYSPLFQVLLTLQEALQEERKVAALTLTGIGIPTVFAKFDLILSIETEPNGITGNLEYDLDLFDAATILRMLGHFHALLEGIVEDPQRRLSALPLLTTPERLQLVAWSGAEATAPVRAPMHEMFEEWARRTPSAIAVVFQGQVLEYRELNENANRLAHRLRSLGCGPEARVGLLLDRSPELIIAILAVLKCGAAYVPLDPQLPTSRLVFILDDSGPRALVTRSDLLGDAAVALPVIRLDLGWSDSAVESRSDPGSPALPESLAYVLYTSGSTGTPKGVMVTHRSLSHYLGWCLAAYPLPQGEAAPVHSSIGFDLTVTSLLAPLAAGGRVLLLQDSPAGEALVEALRLNDSFSVLKLTPSHLELLDQQLGGAGLSGGLRSLVVGGEALRSETLLPWRRRAPQVRIFNEYGPTEATVGCCVYEVLESVPAAGPMPIGRPIPGTRMHVLDPWMQEVPQGVPGELYIGGTGLARGYLGRPDLTADRFGPDSFCDIPGERLYRTGDLGRYLLSGDLEFLGRTDHQVKIRGFRIELGEIESVLAQHPGVRESVVVSRAGEAGQPRLIAYVVGRDREVLDTGELREALGQRLPAYMLPDAFVTLHELPLTRNGKVDRKALPEPSSERSERTARFVPPRSGTEELLAGIWASVLRIEKIGASDNFFTLGGDSILAIQVASRARKAGLRITSRQMFQYQTLESLAAVAEVAAAPAAKPESASATVPLIPIQRWFFEQDLPDPHHYNQGLLLALGEEPDPGLLARVVVRLVEHHDALRLRFESREGGWSQRTDPPGDPSPFCCVDLSALSPDVWRSAIESASAALQASLSLARGPILRVALFRLGSFPARLLLAAHHLAIDGVSWRVLLEDLASGYRQTVRGEEIRLQATTTAFGRWATALVEYARSSAVSSEIPYWTAEPRRKAMRLPIDLPGGIDLVATTARVCVALDAETTRALLQEVPRAYHTQIQEVLLTALVQAFSRWTGERTLLVELEGHGREEIANDIDLSRTIGWFTTRYPVFLELAPAVGPGEALKAIKEQLRAVPRNGLGYGLLRYLSSDEETSRKLRSLPQAEVSFNYLGQLDQALPEDSPFLPAEEFLGPLQSPRGRRPSMLDIVGRVAGGCLRLEWMYSVALHHRETIERLADAYLAALRTLIGHCSSTGAGGLTPSDFPRASLSKKDLGKVLSKIEGSSSKVRR